MFKFLIILSKGLLLFFMAIFIISYEKIIKSAKG